VCVDWFVCFVGVLVSVLLCVVLVEINAIGCFVFVAFVAFSIPFFLKRNIGNGLFEEGKKS
jgi:hypothetical protein